MSLPPPPHGTDLSEDRRPEVITVSVLVSSLAIFSVVLRIVSRRIMGVRIWLDDWLIIASLVSSRGQADVILTGWIGWIVRDVRYLGWIWLVTFGIFLYHGSWEIHVGRY